MWLDYGAICKPWEQAILTTTDWSGRPKSCYGSEGWVRVPSERAHLNKSGSLLRRARWPLFVAARLTLSPISDTEMIGLCSARAGSHSGRAFMGAWLVCELCMPEPQEARMLRSTPTSRSAPTTALRGTPSKLGLLGTYRQNGED